MARKYSPRRQSKRWLDSDCPAGVLAIYDSGPNGFVDRYCVFFAGIITGEGREAWIGYRSMSESPCHPQGVGMYGEMRAHEAASYRYRMRHKAAKWSTLPDEVKRLIRHDCEEEAAQ